MNEKTYTDDTEHVDDNVFNMGDFDEAHSLRNQIQSEELFFEALMAHPKDTAKWSKDCRDVQARIERLKRKLAGLLKQREQAKSGRTKKDDPDKLIERLEMTQTVIDHDINLLVDDEPYRYVYDGKRLTKTQLEAFVPAMITQTGRRMLHEILLGDVEAGIAARHYVRGTYALDPRSGEYPLTRTDHWLTGDGADDQPHLPFYDWLMLSLSSGRPAVQEHIERCILAKLLDPKVRLPALILCGEGGAGKNLLANILAVAVGEQICFTSPEKLSQQFPPRVEAVAVMFADEGTADKTTASAMKRIIGNDVMELEVKNGAIHQVRHYFWGIFASNRTQGPVLLSANRTGEDRRWSMVRCTMTLPSVVADQRGCSIEEAQTWLARLRREGTVLDPANVNRWLAHLRGKYPDIHDTVILPLHGEDYERTIEVQRSPMHRLIRHTLADPAVAAVKRKTMWLMYRALCAYENHPLYGGKARNEQDMIDTARRDFGIEMTLHRQTIKKAGGARATVDFWASADHAGPWVDHTDDFLAIPDRPNDPPILRDPDRFGGQ